MDVWPWEVDRVLNKRVVVLHNNHLDEVHVEVFMPLPAAVARCRHAGVAMPCHTASTAGGGSSAAVGATTAAPAQLTLLGCVWRREDIQYRARADGLEAVDVAACGEVEVVSVSVGNRDRQRRQTREVKAWNETDAVAAAGSVLCACAQAAQLWHQV